VVLAIKLIIYFNWEFFFRHALRVLFQDVQIIE